MDTKDKILNYIKTSGKARAFDIQNEFSLSRAMIHKHLLRMVESGDLVKNGKPPYVVYSIKEKNNQNTQYQIDKSNEKYIEENYLYVTPPGQMLYGIDGFVAWVHKTKQERYLTDLAKEYMLTKKQIDKHKNNIGFIDATQKIKDAFEKCYLDKVYYSDFYSIPKFGKTILGQKILYSKQAQMRNLMHEVGMEVKLSIEKLIDKLQIDHVAFIPQQ